MATEWVDVADNAVKIGLGALITIVGGWITLKLTLRHEIRKDVIVQRLRNIDKKTDRYIDYRLISLALTYALGISSGAVLNLHFSKPVTGQSVWRAGMTVIIRYA